MTSMPPKEVHLRDYLSLLRKHDFLICFTCLIILGSALVVGLRLPKTYVASALILVTESASNSSTSSVNLFQSVLSGGIDKSEVETINQRFATDSMLTRAIENLEDANLAGVRYLPPVGYLKKNLMVRNRPDTQYIDISLSLTEEQGGERNAALLVNQLVDDLQTMRHQEEMDRSVYRKQLLNEKLDDLLGQIRNLEESVFQFARENGTSAVWQVQLSVLLDRQTKLLDLQTQTISQLKASSLERSYLRSEIEKYPDFVKTGETLSEDPTSYDPVWLSYHSILVNLETQRVGMESRVGETSPELKALDDQIADLKAKLAKASGENYYVTSTAQGFSPIRLSIENRLINLGANIPFSQSRLDEIKSERLVLDLQLEDLLDRVPENELFLEKLRREINVIHELRKEIFKQALNAEIIFSESNYWNQNRANRLVTGGIEVVDPAVPRKIAVSPRIKLIGAIAAIVGVCMGISIALIHEYFNGDKYVYLR